MSVTFFVRFVPVNQVFVASQTYNVKNKPPMVAVTGKYSFSDQRIVGRMPLQATGRRTRLLP